jgi:hypothetical protein
LETGYTDPKDAIEKRVAVEVGEIELFETLRDGQTVQGLRPATRGIPPPAEPIAQCRSIPPRDPDFL